MSQPTTTSNATHVTVSFQTNTTGQTYTWNGGVDTSGYPRTHQRVSMLKSSPSGPANPGQIFVDQVTGTVWVFTTEYGWKPIGNDWPKDFVIKEII